MKVRLIPGHFGALGVLVGVDSVPMGTASRRMLPDAARYGPSVRVWTLRFTINGPGALESICR